MSTQHQWLMAHRISILWNRNGKSTVSVCMSAALLEWSGTGGTGASCVAAIATCEGETLGLRWGHSKSLGKDGELLEGLNWICWICLHFLQLSFGCPPRCPICIKMDGHPKTRRRPVCTTTKHCDTLFISVSLSLSHIRSARKMYHNNSNVPRTLFFNA